MSSVQYLGDSCHYLTPFLAISAKRKNRISMETDLISHQIVVPPDPRAGLAGRAASTATVHVVIYLAV